MAGLHEAMTPFYSYTSSPSRQLPEEAFPGQDSALFAPQAGPYPNPALHHRVGQIQRQPLGDGSIKAPYAPSSAPWTLGVSQVDHPAAYPSVEAGGSLAPDFRSYSSDLSSASSAASPRTPDTYMSSYPAECYMTPPYDDSLLSQTGWTSPSQGFLPIAPLHDAYPDPKPIFEPQASIELSPHPVASPMPMPPSPRPSYEKPSVAGGDKPTPRRTRRKRNASPPPLRSHNPKGKVKVKAEVKSKGNKNPEVRPAGRTFACTFRRYGCAGSFTSKNEWKRHVASKHMQLSFYRCDVGICNGTRLEANGISAVSVSKARQRNYFNRKDLFTQHHRRMHTPWAKQNQRYVPSEQEREDFERSLEVVRARCFHEQRQPPAQSTCGFCGHQFTGPHNWDQRMEHVGRHFEKAEYPADAEREDLDLRDWAVQQGILREHSTGEVRLV